MRYIPVFSFIFWILLIWRVTSSCGVLCDFQLACARRFSWYTDCSRDALWLMLWCCEWIIHPLYKSTVVYYTPAVYKLYSARFSLVWRPSPLYSPRLWSPGTICLSWTDLFIFHLVNEKREVFAFAHAHCHNVKFQFQVQFFYAQGSFGATVEFPRCIRCHEIYAERW